MDWFSIEKIMTKNYCPKSWSDQIIVDYYGEIIGLKTIETTLSPMVENIYREEILKLTFSPTNNENPAELSKGKITFIIRNNW